MSNSVTLTVVHNEPKGCKGILFVKPNADSMVMSSGTIG